MSKGENFPDLIKEWWQNLKVEGWAGFKLARKLKLLKGNIKHCVKNHFREVEVKNNIFKGIQL